MMVLDILGYPLLAIALLEIVLGVALLRRGRDDGDPARPAAAVFFFTVAAFAFSAGLAYAAAARGLEYDVFYRLCWTGWLAIPAGLHVVHALEGDRRKRSTVLVAALYAFWITVDVLALATDLVDRRPYSLVPYVDRSAPLESALRVIGSIQLVYLIVLLFRAQRGARGRERLQLSYFLLGLLVMAVGGMASAGLQPLLSTPAFDPALGAWFSAPSVILTFIAITRYRLFDIVTLLSRALGLAVQLLVFGAVHVGLFGAFESVLRPTAAVALSFVLTAILLLGTPIRRRLLASVETLVRRRRQTHHALLRESARAVVTILDADELVAHLTHVVSRGLGASCVAIYVAEGDDAVFLRHAVGGPPDGFPDRIDGPALERLRRAGHGPLPEPCRDLPHVGDPQGRGSPLRSRGLIALPLQYQDHLQGVALLGPRDDGDPYVADDYDVLEMLGYQAAIALANARLYHEATTDDLTGLHHRKYFLRRLEEEKERSRLGGRTLAVLMVDIDRFKRVNDTFGHAVGDRVLKGAARTLLRTLRHPDIAARFGGEEFTVLLCDVDVSSARAVAERIRVAVERDRYAGGTAVTVSVGVAFHDPAEQSLTAHDVVAAADAALYEAKRGGRNRVCTARDAAGPTLHVAPPFDLPTGTSSAEIAL